MSKHIMSNSTPAFIPSFSVCTPTPIVSACVTHSSTNPLTVSACANIGVAKACVTMPSTPQIWKDFQYMSDNCH